MSSLQGCSVIFRGGGQNQAHGAHTPLRGWVVLAREGGWASPSSHVTRLVPHYHANMFNVYVTLKMFYPNNTKISLKKNQSLGKGLIIFKNDCQKTRTFTSSMC